MSQSILVTETIHVTESIHVTEPIQVTESKLSQCSNFSQASTVGRKGTLKPGYSHRQSVLSLGHVDLPPSQLELYEGENQKNALHDINIDEVPFWTSVRFRLAVLCFFGMLNLYSQRVNLTIAIVKMSGPPAHTETEVNLTTASPGDSECLELKPGEEDTEFNWGKDIEGVILGGFYYGYLVLQIPGGMIAEKIGATRVITCGMLPVAVFTIMTPTIARMGPWPLFVSRIFIGLGQGVMYPAIQALWAKWSPPHERSRLIGFSYAGGQMGNALVFPVGGLLCAYGFDNGWGSVFYLTGALGLAWVICWMLFAHDTPNDDKRLGEEEREYILATLGSHKKSHQPPIPWTKLLTNGPVIALTIVHACGNYGYYMLLTMLPAYMKEVLHFDIKHNGAYSMLPYIAFWGCITLSAYLADKLICAKILSVGNTRKLMTTIGTIGPGIMLVTVGYITCEYWIVAVVLLTVSGGLCGFAFSGYFVNHGDIAPPFAGTLFGVTNTVATIPGFAAPSVVSFLTPNGTQEQWQTVFYVAAAIYFFGDIIYLILASGEPQTWAVVEQFDKVDDHKDITLTRSKSNMCLDQQSDNDIVKTTQVEESFWKEFVE